MLTVKNYSYKQVVKIVELCKRYYEQDDESVLPRSIGTFEAFENAMSLDIAMGGSSNTVLHLLAAAQEAGVDFKMADIDRLSRVVPCLSKSRQIPINTTWKMYIVQVGLWVYWAN